MRVVAGFARRIISSFFDNKNKVATPALTLLVKSSTLTTIKTEKTSSKRFFSKSFDPVDWSGFYLEPAHSIELLQYKSNWIDVPFLSDKLKNNSLSKNRGLGESKGLSEIVNSQNNGDFSFLEENKFAHIMQFNEEESFDLSSSFFDNLDGTLNSDCFSDKASWTDDNNSSIMGHQDAQESMFENNETIMKINEDLVFDDTFSEFSLLLKDERGLSGKETHFGKNRQFCGFKN